jgi:hypothetical protein
MATVAAGVNNSVKPRSAPPGRRYDHYFFSAMALLFLGTVFLGFAHTYYLAGLFHAPLPNLLIHIHGAVFSTWILLLIAQTSLVAAGRVSIHRRLGIAGFLLACLMLVLGVLAATDSLARAHARPGFDPLTFYIVPMTGILSFSVLIFFAFRARFNPAAHKRLIMIATTALMVAAIARWPFSPVFGKPYIAALFSNVFLLLLALYDLWSTRKIHRATLWAGVFLIFMQQISRPISHTAAWHSFAAWAQHLGL